MPACYIILLFSLLASCVAQPSDAELSQDWIKSAGDGNEESQFTLGTAFLTGEGAAIQSAEEAAYWFSKSAVSGNRSAQFALANLYLVGSDDGFPKDPYCAAFWFARVEATEEIENIRQQFIPASNTKAFNGYIKDSQKLLIELSPADSAFRCALYVGDFSIRSQFVLQRCQYIGANGKKICEWRHQTLSQVSMVRK